MGMMTDFFDLNGASPEILMSNDGSWSKFKRFSCKGVDPVKLSTLMELLGHGPYKENLEMISPVNPESEEGPWIIPIPHSMSQSLRIVQEDKMSEIANKWCETDELKMDRWTAEETHKFMRGLVDFFKRAEGPVVQLIVV